MLIEQTDLENVISQRSTPAGMSAGSIVGQLRPIIDDEDILAVAVTAPMSFDINEGIDSSVTVVVLTPTRLINWEGGVVTWEEGQETSEVLSSEVRVLPKRQILEVRTHQHTHQLTDETFVPTSVGVEIVTAETSRINMVMSCATDHSDPDVEEECVTVLEGTARSSSIIVAEEGAVSGENAVANVYTFTVALQRWLR